MALETRSSTAERPAWSIPALVFGGVAGSVAVTGSILMFVLSLFAGEPAPPPSPGPVLAQQTSEGASSEPSQQNHQQPLPSQQAPSATTEDTGPAPETAASPPVSTQDSGQTAQPPQTESTLTSPPPAVDAAAVMKDKAKQLDIAEFATIKLPGEAKGFALDPAGGRLGIVGPWEDQVGFLSADDLATGSNTAQPETVSISGEPIAIAYVPRESGGVFAVGAREPDGVTILDAQTLERLKTVPVKLAHPGVLAASQNAARPHLYLTFVGPAERSRPKLGLARIDVERLEMDAQWPEREFRHVSVSPDGQFIYTLPNNSGADLTRSRPVVPDQDGVGGRWHTVTSRLGRVSTRYYVDPRGAVIAAGNNLYSADISQLLMELDFDPLAFVAKQPWMAGIRMNDLVIASTNDGRAVTEISLPGEFLIPDEKLRKQPVKPSTTFHPAAFAQIFADDERNRFVLATRQQIVSLPLDKLDLPDEPHLSLAEKPSNKAIVDAAYEVPLATLSGSPEAELIEGPKGMTIADGVLRWNPTDGDVGFVNVRVELKDDKITHDEAWQVEVGRPKLDVPFLVLGCAASLDGTRAVVWGNEWPQGGKRLSPARERHPGSRLALVDLSTRQVIAKRELDFPVARAQTSKYAIYASPLPPQYSKEPTPVIKFTPDDLRELGEEDVASGLVTTFADRYLICLDPREGSKRYTLPDMKPVETLPAPRWSIHDPPPVPRQLGDGWLLDGVLWDDNLDKTRLLVEPFGFERV